MYWFIVITIIQCELNVRIGLVGYYVEATSYRVTIIIRIKAGSQFTVIRVYVII